MNEGSGKSAKLSLLGSSDDCASLGECFPELEVENVVNNADWGMEEEAALWRYPKEGCLEGESVVNSGAGGAVMGTNPRLPCPENRLLELRATFAGEALCVVEVVAFGN